MAEVLRVTILAVKDIWHAKYPESLSEPQIKLDYKDFVLPHFSKPYFYFAVPVVACNERQRSSKTFEGLGLGSRLATTRWPKNKWWVPWALGSLYGITTPLSVAVGLAVRTTFAPGSNSTLLVNGIFDSISAGILLYTGLVELMAHEFMFNQEMRKASIGIVFSAFGCMCFGAGLMA